MQNKDYQALKLRGVWQRFYLSPDLAARTREAYLDAIGKWELLTRDPTLAELADPIGGKLIMRDFQANLQQVVKSAATCNKVLRHVRAILRRVGPAGPRNENAFEIIARVPYVKPAKEDRRPNRVATLDELSAIYGACDVATWPACPFAAADWWRCLLVLLYNVGPRRGDFLALKRSDVKLSCGLLLVQQHKKRHPQWKPINSALCAHIERIWQPERELLFPHSKSMKSLYRTWYAIQTAAGIVEPYWLHQIRKTCGTQLYAQSPGAAQEMLGHSSPQITYDAYANLTAHLVEASNGLRQPAAFVGEPDGGDDPPAGSILKFPA